MTDRDDELDSDVDDAVGRMRDRRRTRRARRALRVPVDEVPRPAGTRSSPTGSTTIVAGSRRSRYVRISRSVSERLSGAAAAPVSIAPSHFRY